MDTIEILLDEARGVYIPQAFIEIYDPDAWHVPKDRIEILSAGPEHDYYWEAWDEVLRDAYYIADGKGDLKAGRWTLDQDGSLFARHETHEDEENT